MGVEIEHKYLVKNDNFKALATSCVHIKQGYLSKEPERTVRVRIRDDKGYLTVKGKNHGAVRSEFEYEIPVDDACALLSLCLQPILEKTRYIVPFDGHTWEVDEFYGGHAGLVTAEIELKSQFDQYSIPDFIGQNVTGIPQYYNSNL